MSASSNRMLRLLPVLIPLTISLVTGFWGLDLGHHWDEPYNIDLVTNAIKSGVLLPRYYAYPMMMFWLIFAALLPAAPTALQTDLGILDYLHSEAFLLQARGVFLVVSALTIVWVYLVVLEWRKSWKEALLAAGLIGLSWEFNYHIRWITPDGLMTMFGALTTLCIVTAFMRQEHQWRWLKLAAVAAGLTIGSKYPAGLIIVPLMLGMFFLRDAKPIFNSLITPAVKLIGLMGATYLITTPATLLDPIVFVQSLQDMMSQYSGGHEVHTIGRGAEHLWRIIQYFGSVALSPFMPIALILVGFALIGVYAAFRENRKLGMVLISFPVLYLLYFSTQQVMIIRNYLIVLPILAIFVARGVSFGISLMRRQWMQYAAGGVIGVILMLNAGWLGYAAQSISARGLNSLTSGFVRYLEAHPDMSIYVTPGVSEVLTEDLPNLTGSANEADLIAAYGFGDAAHCIPANQPELVLRWFGPLEINYDYYTTWPEERIIVMRAKDAQPYLDCLTD